MKLRRKHLYGLLGLVSLLGLVGIFTEDREFLSFFAFAVNFQYFFIKSDEMMEEYMNKSASRAFCCGMLTTAFVSSACVFLRNDTGGEALLTGFASGWAVSVIVYSLSTAFYGFREKWGLEHD